MVSSPIPPLNLKCISQQRFKCRRDMFTQTRLSATAANFHVTPLCCDLCSCTSHMLCPLSVCLSLSHTHTHTYTCRVKECDEWYCEGRLMNGSECEYLWLRVTANDWELVTVKE